MGTLTPVDYDPFAQGSAETPPVGEKLKLTRVEHDPFSLPAIDFNRPIADIRADIAKIEEGPQRDAALKAWADAAVAKEREAVKRLDVPGTINPTRLPDTIRSAARGTLAGNFLDEALAGASALANKATGGAIGSPYDEAIAFQTARNEALDKEGLRHLPAQLIGAFGSGAPVAKAVLSVPKTVVGKTIAGIGAGGTAGYVAGFGEGQGGIAERNEHALSGEDRFLGLSPTETGVALGGILPPAFTATAFGARKLNEAVSPTLARIGGYLESLPQRHGILASASEAAPETAGARAAAEQTVANWLASEGVKPGDIPARLREIQDAVRYHTSGQAQDASALVDVTPGMQRLGRAIATRSQEANTAAKKFLEARQTGITPPGMTAEETAALGLPTRARMAEPITGEEAVKEFGTHFGAGKENLVPMGQSERYVDALKRAFRIKDSELHGHSINASSTSDAIIDAARAEAQPAYNSLYKAGKSIDVSNAVAPAIEKWREIIADPSSPIPNPIKQIVSRQITQLFAPNGKVVSNIETVDRAKQLLDDRIGALLESPRAPQRQLSNALLTLKNDILKGVEKDGVRIGGVDNIKDGQFPVLDAKGNVTGHQGLGDEYQKVRGQYSSRMEAKEALEAGKQAAEVGGQQGIQIFDAAANTPGHAKLARLGILGHVEGKIGNMKLGADKSSIFDTPNMNQFLAHAIPRSEEAGATFANRPERFGKFVDLQKGQAETRNMIQGGSPTARIEADVNSFDILSKWQELKSSSTATMAGIKYGAHLLNKMFGIQADTAAYIAKNLFTANKAQQAQFVAAVESRLGRSRTEQFTRLMEQHQRDITAASAKQGGKSSASDNE